MKLKEEGTKQDFALVRHKLDNTYKLTMLNQEEIIGLCKDALSNSVDLQEYEKCVKELCEINTKANDYAVSKNSYEITIADGATNIKDK